MTFSWRPSQSPRDRACLGFVVVRGQFCFQISSENDVGTATRHVGGDGNCARSPGLLHDNSLARMLFRVQYLVVDTLLFQDPG